MKKNRRQFLKTTLATTAAFSLGNSQILIHAQGQPEKKPPKNPFSSYRGFNLLEMFTMKSSGDFAEDDFRWIRDWGFNFVRLPLCYRLWIKDGVDYKLYEPMLEKLDRAVRLGEKYGIHVNLNFHRGPGYSVNQEFKEPFNLWKDKAALDAFCFHWQMLAQRYKSISAEKISFNLINEPRDVNNPDHMTRADHERVIRTAVSSIRKVSPKRTIITDGLAWGTKPTPELDDLKIAHSTRAYQPFQFTHYKASWVNYKNFPEPAWPGNGWDRSRLEKHYISWAPAIKKGIPVICGEGGVYNKTPHPLVLAWLRDVLETLKAMEIGFALWNFRGSFGILDSGRNDVSYEDFHGHKLDRKMLKLLQEILID
jgi:endoglucanase